MTWFCDVCGKMILGTGHLKNNVITCMDCHSAKGGGYPEDLEVTQSKTKLGSGPALEEVNTPGETIWSGVSCDENTTL